MHDSLFSIALTKSKQVRKGFICLNSSMSHSIIETLKSGQEFGGRNRCKGHCGMLLSELFLTDIQLPYMLEDPLPIYDTDHSCLGPSASITNPENFLEANRKEIFFICVFFLLEESSFCQDDKTGTMINNIMQYNYIYIQHLMYNTYNYIVLKILVALK